MQICAYFSPTPNIKFGSCKMVSVYQIRLITEKIRARNSVFGPKVPVIGAYAHQHIRIFGLLAPSGALIAIPTYQ